MRVIDASQLPSGSTITADICVVGSGAAGMTVATGLDGTDQSVCLLESGGYAPDEATQALYDLDVVGHPVPASSPLSGWLTEVRALPEHGGEVEVWWPATTRDFVHVDDVATSLIDLALVDAAPAVGDSAAALPPLVNVCTGTGIRFGEIVEALAAELGRPVQVRSLERPGIECVVGDPSLLISLTGSAPTMTLERLARTVVRGD